MKVEKETKSAAGKKSSSAIQIERERSEFRALLQTNPNYFGNLADSKFKPVVKFINKTSYEEATCVGFDPKLTQLEATVQIKRPAGYGGDLCQTGTTEYVRFYIDYGSGWEDVNYVAFDVHDIPNGTDCADKPEKPLSYVASLKIEPRRKVCEFPVLPKVRAILSWNLLPPANQPNWIPVWGNVLDQHIQITPRRHFLIDVVDTIANANNLKLKLPLKFEPAQTLPIPIPEPDPLELPDLVKLYGKEGKAAAKAVAVEPHRFAFADIQASASDAVFSQEVVAAKFDQYKALGLDYSAIIAALEKVKANVSYEEVECLGLDYNLEQLAATFRIKRPFGYSGQLCQLGSLEYIAFWADWDDKCEWEYQGTVKINVHDIPAIPADGLAYTAVLKVNLDPHRRSCTRPKVARIRAVLSWATPPSTTDPNALTIWGNRLDTHVLIKPGKPGTPTSPKISILGGIGVAQINTTTNGRTKPFAVHAHGGYSADQWVPSRECPFGGLVTVQGPPLVGYKYRVWVQNVTAGTPPSIVANKVLVTDENGVSTYHAADGLGFFTYLSDLQNINDELAHWHTSGDDLWEVRLEVATLADVVVGSTSWHRIQLDNSAPSKPSDCDIHIDSGGDCKDFNVGDVINGHFVARDPNFGHYDIEVLPASLSPNGASPSAGNAQTAISPGNVWTLNTGSPKKMDPCGYVVRLVVWDRSIVGSIPFSHNASSADIGFCLRG